MSLLISFITLFSISFQISVIYTRVTYEEILDWRLWYQLFSCSTQLILLINVKMRSGEGIVGMPFVCPSVH